MEADATHLRLKGESDWTFQEALPLAVKNGRRSEKKMGRVGDGERKEEASFLFLATSTRRCALQSDRAPCFIFFCLLINISEHYAWNAPVTLNMGGLSTFFSDKS